jgi:phage terminase large subunit
LDNDGRLYRYRQIYITKRLVEDHARQAKTLTGEERIEAIICDHDAEDRATWERHFGQTTQSANKAITIGIQTVQARLRLAGDGKPRIFFLADSLVERDQSLAENYKPVCTEDEFESYSWPKAADGKPIKEVPIDADNHGMDEMRYMVMHLDEGNVTWDDLNGLGKWKGITTDGNRLQWSS